MIGQALKPRTSSASRTSKCACGASRRQAAILDVPKEAIRPGNVYLEWHRQRVYRGAITDQPP